MVAIMTNNLVEGYSPKLWTVNGRRKRFVYHVEDDINEQERFIDAARRAGAELIKPLGVR